MAALKYARQLGGDEWFGGSYAPALLTDAFGDLVVGNRQTYDWNGLWGYRKERKALLALAMEP